MNKVLRINTDKANKKDNKNITNNFDECDQYDHGLKIILLSRNKFVFLQKKWGKLPRSQVIYAL